MTKQDGFAGNVSHSLWIYKGVILGDHPTRKLEKYFSSRLHKQCIETEKMFQKRPDHAMLQQKLEEKEEEDKLLDRRVLRSMFGVVL